MDKRDSWFEQFLGRIQEFRYGNPGIAVAASVAAFTILWTVLDAAGLQGSVTTFLIILYISTVVGYSTHSYLYARQHQRELLAYKYATTVGILPPRDKNTKTIGVVAPLSFWSTDYYVEIIKAIRDAADREVRSIQRRVVVLDVPHEELVDVKTTLTEELVSQVGGLITINLQYDESVRGILIKNGIPVVNITHEDSAPPSVCSILPDHSGFEEVVQNVLVQKGCSSAVLVTKGLSNPFKGIRTDPTRKEKRDIFVRTAKKAGLVVQHPLSLIELSKGLLIKPGDAHILEVDRYSPEYGEHILQNLLRPVPPNTAFFFLADIVAIGFLVACQRNGPSARDRNFRVAGFDNSLASSWFGLTTVDYQLNVVGRLAYERLQMALDFSDKFTYSKETVKTIGIFRESTNW